MYKRNGESSTDVSYEKFVCVFIAIVFEILLFDFHQLIFRL